MTMLRRFESFMEHLLETSVSRFLKQPLDNQTIERRLQRSMESNQVDIRHQIYVPHRYATVLHPTDYTGLLRQHPMLEYDLTIYLTRLAQERGFATFRAIEVIVTADASLQRGAVDIRTDSVSATPSDMTAAAAVVVEAEEPPARSTQVDTAAERFPINAQYALSVTINGEVHSIPIVQTEVTIGRSTKNHVVLPDPLVSRDHARINYSGRRFTITDLGTRNGTRVNGSVIRGASAPLSINNDTITIGSYTLKLTIAHADE
jgi:hypothetical protein